MAARALLLVCGVAANDNGLFITLLSVWPYTRQLGLRRHGGLVRHSFLAGSVASG